MLPVVHRERVGVLMNLEMEPVPSVWIGTPKNPSSIFQEIVYKTLPAYCSSCHVQGQNLTTCKVSKKKDHEEKKNKVILSSSIWILKDTEHPGLKAIGV